MQTYVRDAENSCPEGADGLRARPKEVSSDEARHWKGALEGCVNRKVTELHEQGIKSSEVQMVGRQ